jgi:hypothetical protein
MILRYYLKYLLTFIEYGISTTRQRENRALRSAELDKSLSELGTNIHPCLKQYDANKEKKIQVCLQKRATSAS